MAAREGATASEAAGAAAQHGTEDSTAPYGLVGHPLGHSFSPAIHAQLGSVPYQLHDLDEANAARFMREDRDWRGLNVTIPYKRLAAELADERTGRVERLGVANTLVRRADGTILAENTDVLGFAWMLERFCQRVLGADAPETLSGREALVLGSGGAAQAVIAALEDAGMRVSVISRRGPDTYEGLAERHADAALVVNATPVGMYPDCPASPLAPGTLERLGRLVGVLDVVYNPRRTGIMLAAERAGIPCESGLAMLVAQALCSSRLFQGRDLPDSLASQIISTLARQTRNIVLVGMPGVGKTSAGRRLARILSRPFIDMDDAFDLAYGQSAASYIAANGEDAFRALETDLCREYGRRSGLVIACGGGVVTRERNYPLLHQNGIIALLDRPAGQLSDKGRPLSQAKGIERLAAERAPLYRRWADLTVECTGSATGDAERLAELLG